MADFNLDAQIRIVNANAKTAVAQINRELKNVKLPNLNFGVGSNSPARTAAATGKSFNVLSTATTKLDGSIKSLSGSFEKNRKVQAATSKQLRANITNVEEFADKAGLALRRFTAFSLAAGGVFGALRGISSSISEAIKFERELLRVTQVTKALPKDINALRSSIGDLSTEFGSESSELVSSAKVLSQAGFNLKQTQEALKAVAQSTLSPTFKDAAQTTEGLIAASKQFNIEAANLGKSLGSINAVSAQFAVESDDIIKAIQRAGGVFAASSQGIVKGNDALAEFISLFASVRSTTRESAETIATGLRTITTRLQRPETIDFFKGLNIQLSNAEGQFVGTTRAIQTIGKALSNLPATDIRFSDIVERIGGFRQVSRVIPLLQQTSKQTEILNVALQGQDSISNDVAIAQQNLAVQLQQTGQQFSALVREIVASDSFQFLAKSAISLTQNLIELASALKDVIPLLGALGAARGISALARGGLGTFAGRVLFNRPATGRQAGGFIPGSGTGDKIPIMTEPGEFVLRKEAVQKIGVNNVKNLNKIGRIGKFKNGGFSSFSEFSQQSKRFLSETDKLGIPRTQAAEIVRIAERKRKPANALAVFDNAIASARNLSSQRLDRQRQASLRSQDSLLTPLPANVFFNKKQSRNIVVRSADSREARTPSAQTGARFGPLGLKTNVEANRVQGTSLTANDEAKIIFEQRNKELERRYKSINDFEKELERTLVERSKIKREELKRAKRIRDFEKGLSDANIKANLNKGLTSTQNKKQFRNNLINALAVSAVNTADSSGNSSLNSSNFAIPIINPVIAAGPLSQKRNNIRVTPPPTYIPNRYNNQYLDINNRIASKPFNDFFASNPAFQTLDRSSAISRRESRLLKKNRGFLGNFILRSRQAFRDFSGGAGQLISGSGQLINNLPGRNLTRFLAPGRNSGVTSGIGAGVGLLASQSSDPFVSNIGTGVATGAFVSQIAGINPVIGLTIGALSGLNSALKESRAAIIQESKDRLTKSAASVSETLRNSIGQSGLNFNNIDFDIGTNLKNQTSFRNNQKLGSGDIGSLFGTDFNIKLFGSVQDRNNFSDFKLNKLLSEEDAAISKLGDGKRIELGFRDSSAGRLFGFNADAERAEIANKFTNKNARERASLQSESSEAARELIRSLIAEGRKSSITEQLLRQSVQDNFAVQRGGSSILELDLANRFVEETEKELKERDAFNKKLADASRRQSNAIERMTRGAETASAVLGVFSDSLQLGSSIAGGRLNNALGSSSLNTRDRLNPFNNIGALSTNGLNAAFNSLENQTGISLGRSRQIILARSRFGELSSSISSFLGENNLTSKNGGQKLGGFISGQLDDPNSPIANLPDFIKSQLRDIKLKDDVAREFANSGDIKGLFDALLPGADKLADAAQKLQEAANAQREFALNSANQRSQILGRSVNLNESAAQNSNNFQDFVGRVLGIRQNIPETSIRRARESRRSLTGGAISAEDIFQNIVGLQARREEILSGPQNEETSLRLSENITALENNNKALNALSSDIAGLAEIEQELAQIQSARQSAGRDLFSQLTASPEEKRNNTRSLIAANRFLNGANIQNLRRQGFSGEEIRRGVELKRNTLATQGDPLTRDLRLKEFEEKLIQRSVDQARANGINLNVPGFVSPETKQGQTQRERELEAAALKGRNEQKKAEAFQNKLLDVNLQKFDAAISETFKRGSDAISSAAQGLRDLPTEFNHTIKHDGQIQIVGADVFKELEPNIRRVVENIVRKAIRQQQEQ